MALFLGTLKMARFLSNFCDQKEKCPKSLLDWSLTIEKCSVVFSNNKKLRSNFRSNQVELSHMRIYIKLPPTLGSNLS